MFFESTFDNKLGDGQLLISIGLSSMGFDEISGLVQGVLSEANCSPNSFARIHEDRRKLTEQLKKTCGNNLDNVSFFKAVFTLFCNKKIIDKTEIKGGKNERTRISLKDWSPSIDLDELFQRCITYMMSYNPRYYLFLYCSTSVFKDVFRPIVEATIRDPKRFVMIGNRTERTIKDDVEEIIFVFQEAVYKNHSTGWYNNDSCNPIAALRSIFDGPFLKGSSNDQNSNIFKVYNILNSLGQERLLGDNKTTSLELVSSEDSDDRNIERAMGLNFREISSKIQKASSILFDHSHFTITYFDIVSRYCCDLIKEKLRRNSKVLNNLGLIKFDVKGLENIITVGVDEPTVRAKRLGKEQFCVILDKIMRSDVNSVDLSSLYKELRRCNDVDCKDNKNGISLYSKSGAKILIGDDGEITKQVVEGFYALKMLVTYLNDNPIINIDGVETKITIFDVPTKIFRDAYYNRRFYSLEEYISLENVASKFYVDANYAIEKNVQESDYFEEILLKDNDTIYNTLCLPALKQKPTARDLLKNRQIVDLRDIIKNKQVAEERVEYGLFVRKGKTAIEKYLVQDSKFKINFIDVENNNKIAVEDTLVIKEWVYYYSKIIQPMLIAEPEVKELFLSKSLSKDAMSFVKVDLFLSYVDELFARTYFMIQGKRSIDLRFLLEFSEFMEVIKLQLAVAKVKVEDKTSSYLCSNKTLLEVLDPLFIDYSSVNMHDEVKKKQFTTDVKNKVLYIIHFAYANLLGREKVDSSELNSGAAIFSLFSVAKYVRLYAKSYYDMYQDLDRYSRDNYLALINSERYKRLIEANTIPDKRSDLVILDTSFSPLLKLKLDENLTTKDLKEYTSLSWDLTVQAIKVFMQGIPMVRSSLELLDTAIKDYSLFKINFNSDSEKIGRILNNAFRSVTGSPSLTTDPEAVKILETTGKKDEYGYLMSGNGRFLLRNRYLNALGFSVSVDTIMGTSKVHMISRDEAIEIKVRINR